jgi:hypothetical protein
MRPPILENFFAKKCMKRMHDKGSVCYASENAERNWMKLNITRKIDLLDFAYRIKSELQNYVLEVGFVFG